MEVYYTMAFETDLGKTVTIRISKATPDLPKSIAERKKNPFPKIHNPAYLQKVREMMQAVINTPNAPLFSILNKKSLNHESPMPWYGQLMAQPQKLAYFLQINAWLTKYNVEIKL